GGLSVLWGAAILPFSDADLDGWPVSAADLAPHYTAVLNLTGLAAADDGLSRRYPLYVTPSSLAPSRQAQLVLQHSGGHAAALEEQGVLVGRARLAVAQPNRSGQSCAYCGMCLYGCPYGLIYSASHTLEQLLGSPAFTYAGGL